MTIPCKACALGMIAVGNSCVSASDEYRKRSGRKTWGSRWRGKVLPGLRFTKISHNSSAGANVRQRRLCPMVRPGLCSDGGMHRRVALNEQDST